MVNKKFKDFQKSKQSIESPTLYDMNKQLIEQLQKEPLSDEEIQKALDSIVSPFFEKNIIQRINREDYDNCYFMLLCREDNNYTVFNIGNYLDITQPLQIACMELKICLNNRGQVYSIENTEDNYAIEIWLKDSNKGLLCYYLFPYNEGVIEI